MIGLPNPWVILAFVLAVGGAYVAGKVEGDDDGAARVQQAWDRSDRLASAMRASRIESNRKTEQGLQADADKERETIDAEKKRLAAGLDAALRELRNRPARPSGLQSGDVPTPAGADAEVGGCTGARLYRDDGEFLARFARTAQLVRADRDACYKLYNQARDKVNGATP
jgi:hypothetical protein